MPTSDYFVYILNCENGHYYTGYTTNLERRYQEHILGTAKCKYTRSFKPIGIAQSWKIPGDKSLAMKYERLIKNMSKLKKQQLILFPEQLYDHLD